MRTSLLEIERLTITARTGSVDRTVIDDVSLSLGRGEVLGLIGESGAGKTTLGLAAMGHVRPGSRRIAGRVLFGDLDLAGLSEAELRPLRGARIAYIAQSAAASLNPAKRLGRQVAETIVLHRGWSWTQAERRAAALFEELDLPEPGRFGSRFPHEVSGGQLQRAMVAMALACEPELLILDEPTTALDVRTQIEVVAAVRTSLRRHGASAIYISHDLALVAQLAHRLVIMRDGKLVESGATSQILAEPERDYTRRLVSAQTLRIPGAPNGPHSDGDGAAEAALTVEGIGASYRDRPSILRDIHLRLARGTTLAIVGASGSGKSTLARTICGLLTADTGTMSLGGEKLPLDARRRRREQLRRIQLIYQTPDTALNPRQTIGTILGRVEAVFFRSRRLEREKRVTELLAMVGLPADFAGRLPSELSGGQKQRIGIARALAARPSVIVCDEITASLDPLIGEDILALLAELQRSTGIAVIFITHDLNAAFRIADSVAVMQAGQITVQGQVGEVFAPPVHPDALALLEAMPQMRVDWLSDLLERRQPATNDDDARQRRKHADLDHAPSQALSQ